MNNPYTPGSPVQEACMFFGRAAELSEIGAFLNGNQSVSIVGPRGIGKTSLLRRLSLPIMESGVKKLFVSIDCQALSHGSKDEILVNLCSKMAEALHNQGQEPEPAVEVVVSRPAWAAFEGALRKLSQRGLRVVLLLDEFEQLTLNPLADVSFYNALRSAAGRLRLVFVIASTRPLVELTYLQQSQGIQSSPFFNIFAQFYLGLLSEPEARALIRVPMETAGRTVSQRLEDFIYSLAGGHPLALQSACSHAWEGLEDFTKIEQETRQDLEPYFQSAWQVLSPVEREVLYHPVEAGRRAAGSPALATALRDLTRKCFLVQVDGEYRYPSKAWAEFVAAYPYPQIR